MPPRADNGDGGKGRLHGGHGHAHDLFRAEPRGGLNFRWGIGEDAAEKIGAPGFGVKFCEAGIEVFFGGALFAGYIVEQRGEQVEAVGPPSPRAEAAELAGGETWQRRAGGGEFHKFGQMKPGLFKIAQKSYGRCLPHEHEVVLAAEELREVLEVARELRLRLGGVECFAFGKAALGEGVEHKNAWSAAFGLRIDIETGDEFRFQPGGKAAGDIEGKAFGALRREREFQHAAEGVPIALGGVFPATKPF